MMVPEKGQAKETAGHEFVPGCLAFLVDFRFQKLALKGANTFGKTRKGYSRMEYRDSSASYQENIK